MRTHYVEVAEHDTATEFVPFAARQPKVPGSMYVSRIYGPFTPNGAERVARRALAQVTGDVHTYPVTGVRYVSDDNGTRVVRVHARMPFGWDRVTKRNMPEDNPYRLTSAREVARLTSLVIGDERGMACPCSRYGGYTEDCASFAVAAAIVLWEANGQGDDEMVTLDGMMSLAVNDHPDIAEMIADHWYVIPRGLRQTLGGLRHVRELARS